MRRSARRQTVRATCSAAPAGDPPARMKRRSGGRSASSRSIVRSRRATSASPSDALATRLGDRVGRIGELGAERRTGRAGSAPARRRTRRRGARRARGRATRSARRLRRTHRRGRRSCSRACRRRAMCRRRRRCACRFSLTRIIQMPAKRDRQKTKSQAAAAAEAARSPTLPDAPADVVPPARPRSAVADDRRSVPHPRLGDHAAADAGRSRAAEVRGVAREISVVRRAGRRARARGDADVVSARLQHPAEAPAVDRARGRRELRRRAALG